MALVLVVWPCLEDSSCQFLCEGHIWLVPTLAQLKTSRLSLIPGPQSLFVDICLFSLEMLKVASLRGTGILLCKIA